MMKKSYVDNYERLKELIKERQKFYGNNDDESVFIDTEQMINEVPESVKFGSYVKISDEKTFKFFINMIQFCPDRKNKKAGMVVKNMLDEKGDTHQIIYFFADDKYTCRRLNKLFRTNLPWSSLK
jgi:coenzyme F420-reducing hydrogenase alpha subunit